MSRDEPIDKLRHSDDELPPDLKATEAQLAMLAPRNDRLDREKLIFLAGQASVATSNQRGGRSGGWAWPASLAAMTTAAAALLAMLLVRPSPQIVERVRIVEVPVERPSQEGGTAGAEREVPESPRPEPVSEPIGAATLASADLGSDWLSRFDTRGSRWRSAYLQAFDQVLASQIDPSMDSALPTHLVALPEGEDEQAAGPTPYRELLKTMLDDQQQAESSSDWPNILLDPGANS